MSGENNIGKAVTQADLQQQQQLFDQERAEHPEWFEGDIYCGTDQKAHDDAKVTLAQRESEAIAQKKLQEAASGKPDPATGEGGTGSAHPGATPKLSTSQMSDVVNGLELTGALGDMAQFKARQHLLNPNDYRKEFKSLNPGKPPNNKAEYPVDLKIEEFEAHTPAVNVDELTVPVCTDIVSSALLCVADHAEKRIIKLENNMATVLRYLMRLGSRVNINCVYWGGTTPFEKYKCIRCLADDRVSDGQFVQIDQCMNCTRYEPVYGQMYELMNDLGANTAMILDDLQMGYSNVKEYINLTRVEKMHTEKKQATFDMNLIKTRDANETTPTYDLKQRWGKGINVSWKYVPKQLQKCHINWRQNIEDDGSKLKRLDSWPASEANSGFNVVPGKDGKKDKDKTKKDGKNLDNLPAAPDKGKDAKKDDKKDDTKKDNKNIVDGNDVSTPQGALAAELKWEQTDPDFLKATSALSDEQLKLNAIDQKTDPQVWETQYEAYARAGKVITDLSNQYFANMKANYPDYSMKNGFEEKKKDDDKKDDKKES